MALWNYCHSVRFDNSTEDCKKNVYFLEIYSKVCRSKMMAGACINNSVSERERTERGREGKETQQQMK